MNEKITVWIIDDDQVNNLICKTMLNEEQWVSDIREFNDSRQAFDQLSQLSESDYPEAILLDINMPGLSGWQFLENAKSQLPGFQAETIPCVLLLTSSIDESDEVRADEHPMVEGMLSKPLDLKRMKEICFKNDHK
ncbi:response regulator [Halocola ammonii]